MRALSDRVGFRACSFGFESSHRDAWRSLQLVRDNAMSKECQLDDTSGAIPGVKKRARQMSGPVGETAGTSDFQWGLKE